MSKHREAVYCSNQCQQDLSFKEYLKRWKAGQEKGTRGKDLLLAKPIRRYIIDKKGGCCEQCGWNTRHPASGRTPLHIHHKDGNATNCRESNLQLLCPNCHSLTDNFGSRNRLGRKRRKKLIGAKSVVDSSPDTNKHTATMSTSKPSKPSTKKPDIVIPTEKSDPWYKEIKNTQPKGNPKGK